MIVPLWVKIAAAGAILVAGFGAGWTIRDWKRDAEVLAEMKAATKLVQKQTDRISTAATAYEKERASETTQSTVRENTIREIYKDRPVAIDCAIAPDAGRMLDQAISAANSRTTGEPKGTVPTD